MPHKPRSRKGFVMDTTNHWIVHDGGICPVKGTTRVQVKWCNGMLRSGLAMRISGQWNHNDSLIRHDDIIAYRVVPQ